MSRTMFDSTNVSDIPTSARMVGYYVDGAYAVSQATVRARFPSAILVGISAIGANAGVVGDVEPGCMSPQQGVKWVKMRRLSGVDPTIYCNETYGLPSVRAAFRYWGVGEPHYWCANYDGIARLRAGEVARQYANPTLTGRHYDLSVVADHWPGVDGTPPSGIGGGPAPGNLPGDDMTPREDELLIALASQFIDISETKGPPPIKTQLDAILAAIKAIPAATGGTTDLAPVITLLQAIKDHPNVVSDPALKASVDALSKHLGIGNA